MAARRPASSSIDGDLGADVPRDGGDQHADRAAADDHDVSPATSSPRRTSCTATATGSTSAAWSRRKLVGQCDQQLGVDVPEPCSAPGESMPMKSRFWQMCWLPARQPGQVPSQRSGMTVTGSPTLHAGDPVTDRGDRAAHLVADDGRDLDPGVHVAVEDVQVGAAEAGIGNLDLHLARSTGSGSRW